MVSNRPPRRVYAVALLVAVSILSGLLIAGLAFPLASLGTRAAKIASDSVTNLPAELEAPTPSERSQILLADGSVLATFYNENRVYTKLDKIAKSMQDAQIAVEDHNFYEHGAINLDGIVRQFVRNSRSGEITGGGSTLTQQYVKLILIEKAVQAGDKNALEAAQEPTFERKIREMRYAIALEKKLSKKQILEGYLNLAYYGAGAYGVEAAAKRYFNTTAAKLTVAQSAMLAGLVQNPSDTDPINNLDKALNRRSFVLGRMREWGFINAKQEADANATAFDTSKVQPFQEGCKTSRYPHICEYAKRVLLSEDMKVMGSTPEKRENMLMRGGLTIKTTIDPRVNDAAQKAIGQLVAPTDPAIGVLTMMEPKTGQIVAMVQSRPKMGEGPGKTHLTYAVGENMGGSMGFFGGSTFKPFILASALQDGIPATRSYNAPGTMDFSTTSFRTCGQPYRAGRGNWPPVRGGYGGARIDMVTATAKSVNTYFMQLLRDVGICPVTKMATNLGLESGSGAPFKDLPTFGLGQSEITPLSLTASFSTFANRGVRCTPKIISSITSHGGKALKLPADNCKQVLDPHIADAVNNLLTGPLKFGTASSFALPSYYSQAGKTGTGAESTAVSFAGYTPELAASVMLGVDRQSPFWKGRKESLMNITFPSGKFISGFGSDTGRVWRNAMLAGLKGRPNTKFVDPPSKYLVGEKVPVPNVSGMGYEGAKATLEAAGFATTIQRIYSDRPEGTFLGITPSGRAPKRSTIALLVSKGPAPVAPTPPPSAPQPPGPNRPSPAPTSPGP